MKYERLISSGSKVIWLKVFVFVHNDIDTVQYGIKRPLDIRLNQLTTNEHTWLKA